MNYSKYFGAKRRGFIKSRSVFAPKGAIHLLSENISYDIIMKICCKLAHLLNIIWKICCKLPHSYL
jgi:hypothetical protein